MLNSVYQVSATKGVNKVSRPRNKNNVVYLKCMEPTNFLTVGKFYLLLDRKNNDICVKDDIGFKRWVNRGCFSGYYYKK